MQVRKPSDIIADAIHKLKYHTALCEREHRYQDGKPTVNEIIQELEQLKEMTLGATARYSRMTH